MTPWTSATGGILIVDLKHNEPCSKAERRAGEIPPGPCRWPALSLAWLSEDPPAPPARHLSIGNGTFKAMYLRKSAFGDTKGFR